MTRVISERDLLALQEQATDQPSVWVEADVLEKLIAGYRLTKGQHKLARPEEKPHADAQGRLGKTHIGRLAAAS